MNHFFDFYIYIFEFYKGTRLVEMENLHLMQKDLSDDPFEIAYQKMIRDSRDNDRSLVIRSNSLPEWHVEYRETRQFVDQRLAFNRRDGKSRRRNHNSNSNWREVRILRRLSELSNDNDTPFALFLTRLYDRAQFIHRHTLNTTSMYQRPFLIYINGQKVPLNFERSYDTIEEEAITLLQRGFDIL